MSSIQAQLSKGRIMVSISSTLNKEISGSDLAGLGYTVNQYSSPTGAEYESDKIFGFNLIPSAAYFIIDNLAAGLNFTIAYNKNKEGDYVNNVTDFQLCAVPFARYYYPLEKFYPFIEVNGGIGIKKYIQESSNFKNTYNWGVTQFGGGAGIALPLGERITLDVMAAYSRLAYKRKVEDPSNEYTNIYGTFGIKLGFTAFFSL
jgi:outer membrane protein W